MKRTAAKKAPPPDDPPRSSPDPRVEPDDSFDLGEFDSTRERSEDSQLRIVVEPMDLGARLEAAEARARDAEQRYDVMRARADAAERARADADTRARAAARIVARFRGTLDTLERIEFELAEARADCASMVTAACAELGLALEPHVPTQIDVRSVPAERQDVPTVRPEAFDIGALMRSVDNL